MTAELGALGETLSRVIEEAAQAIERAALEIRAGRPAFEGRLRAIDGLPAAQRRAELRAIVREALSPVMHALDHIESASAPVRRH